MLKSSNTSTEDLYKEVGDLMTSENLQIVRFMSRHFIPLFCLFGILGNSMALMLLRTNHILKRLASNSYLFVLSLSGCLFLATVLICWVDSMMVEVPLYSNSEFGCRVLTFVAHMTDFNCVYMISWVSCDRAVVLCRPSLMSRVCTRNFARSVVFFTVLCSCLLYSLCFVLAGLEIEDGKVFCGITKNSTFLGPDLRNRLYFYFTVTDTVVCTVFPSAVIFIVNCIAIYRYRQCIKLYTTGIIKVRFENNENDETNQPATQDNARKTLLSRQSQTSCSLQSKNASSYKMRYSDLRLSCSLIIATSTFVGLTFPSYCFRIYMFWFETNSELIFFASFLAYLLYYIHHAVLSYIYIFWSPHMKKQMKPAALMLLECYCFKTVRHYEQK